MFVMTSFRKFCLTFKSGITGSCALYDTYSARHFRSLGDVSRNGQSSFVRDLSNHGFENITPVLEHYGLSCKALQLGSDMLMFRCPHSFVLFSESVFAI